MIVWRLCRPIHQSKAYTGEGSAKFGGRWNPVGIPVVYTSANAATAVLEIVVHATRDELFLPHVAISAELPDDLIEDADAYFFKDVSKWEYDEAVTAAAGAKWAKTASSLALRVPSAVLPIECNYILNPQHPAFASAVKIVDSVDIRFDPRIKAEPTHT